jgi:predicted dehydrogenase
MISRRSFLHKTGLAVAATIAFPTIIPSRVLGKDGAISPSNRIVIGAVGMGQGHFNMTRMLPFKDVQVVSICDVDDKQAAKGKQTVDNHYQNTDARTYRDFRDMFAKDNLDAVILAAPDHWHGIMSVAAARAGLDIFGEKPLAHTLREGRAICNAVRQHGRIWQTGSWQRSVPNFRQAVELVRNGRLGKITNIEVGTFGNFNGNAIKPPEAPKLDRIPRELNYNLWLGPAPWRDYDSRIVHYNWRWNLDFGGGNLMDWVGHHVDIAHWAMDLDHTGPVKVSGSGEYGIVTPWNAETKYRYACTYQDGLTITVSSDFKGGTKFYGERGWIHVDRGVLEASDPAILRETPNSGELFVYRSDDHWRNFIDCIKDRRNTISPCEAAHRSASVGHLGHIAILTGRTIRWNPRTETILDDPGATALLEPAFRSPWVL